MSGRLRSHLPFHLFRQDGDNFLLRLVQVRESGQLVQSYQGFPVSRSLDGHHDVIYDSLDLRAGRRKSRSELGGVNGLYRAVRDYWFFGLSAPGKSQRTCHQKPGNPSGERHNVSHCAVGEILSITDARIDESSVRGQVMNVRIPDLAGNGVVQVISIHSMYRSE